MRGLLVNLNHRLILFPVFISSSGGTVIARIMLGVGLLTVTIGVTLLAVPAGLICGGACLVAVALFVDGN